MPAEPLSAAAVPGPRARSAALRFGQLILGLFGWGIAIALLIRAELGLGPWDAFHYGLHLQTGITVGTASILAGAVILLVTTRMGLRPGLGTWLNMLLIGVFIDLLLPVVPRASWWPLAVAYFAVAILLTGLASGMYIGAGFGHGPRDGLMVALAVRSGWSVRRIRTLIEATVLVGGWLMGGPVGLGTVAVMATIGPSVQWGLRLFGAMPSERGGAGRPAKG